LVNRTDIMLFSRKHGSDIVVIGTETAYNKVNAGIWIMLIR
jgi:hypothetical protein